MNINMKYIENKTFPTFEIPLLFENVEMKFVKNVIGTKPIDNILKYIIAFNGKWLSSIAIYKNISIPIMTKTVIMTDINRNSGLFVSFSFFT